MADTLKGKFDVEIELIEGSSGIFDVVADGVTVFSKHSAGRFPDGQEIVDKLVIN